LILFIKRPVKSKQQYRSIKIYFLKAISIRPPLNNEYQGT
jgi:hypothetical protein